MFKLAAILTISFMNLLTAIIFIVRLSFSSLLTSSRLKQRLSMASSFPSSTTIADTFMTENTLTRVAGNDALQILVTLFT